MSHLSNTEFLEYYYNEGIAQGMSEEDAIDYAEQAFDNWG